MLDLRKPSGWFFLLTGILLVILGVSSDQRPPLTDVNVNLYVGLSLLIFGAILLWLSRRAT